MTLNEKYYDYLTSKKEESLINYINQELQITNKFEYFTDNKIPIPIKLDLFIKDKNIIIKEQFDWKLHNEVSISKFIEGYKNILNYDKLQSLELSNTIKNQIINYVSNMDIDKYEKDKHSHNTIDNYSKVNRDYKSINYINKLTSELEGNIATPYFDFLKKKCEFCNKLSYKYTQQCKNCRFFLFQTKNYIVKSKQFKFCLKFFENLIFHSGFINDKIIYKIKQFNLASINLLLKKLFTLFKNENGKIEFIKLYTKLYIKNINEDDKIEFKEEEKELLSDKLKEFSNGTQEFEIRDKPKSRRGAHLIGIGRNIKLLKKEGN